MRKLSFACAAAVAIFASCQNNHNENGASVLKPEKQCFVYSKNKDTATLDLSVDGNAVSGILSYNLFEKDKNSGVIAGFIKGDTIIADYTFQAEGTTSIRQVAWLKKGDKLMEGYGETEETEGKSIFKDTAKLTFGQAVVFNKINCK